MIGWTSRLRDCARTTLRGAAFCCSLAAGLALAGAQQFTFQQLPEDNPPNATATPAPVSVFASAVAPRPTAGPLEAMIQPAPPRYRLQFSTWREIEQKIATCWLDGQQPLISGEGRFSSFQFTAGRGPATLVIDRQTGEITCTCDPAAAESWVRCMAMLDKYDVLVPGGQVALVPVHQLDAATIYALAENLRSPFAPGKASPFRQASFANRQDETPQNPAAPNPQDPTLPGVAEQPQEPQPAQRPVIEEQVQVPGQEDSVQDLIAQLKGDEFQTAIGNVTVEFVPELNMYIVKGENKEDVERVKALISRIIQISARNQPRLERVPLRNAQPAAIAEQVRSVYDSSYAANQGAVAITYITNPRALLISGSSEAIRTLKEIIAELDSGAPAEPEVPEFRKYDLKYITAGDAKQRIDEYFGQAAQGFGAQTAAAEPAPVFTIADFRSNTLVVKASQVYLQQVDQLIEAFDVVNTERVMAARVFRLKNTLASNAQVVLQGAINGNQQGAGQGTNPNPQFNAILQNQGQFGNQAVGQGQPGQSRQGAQAIQLVTVGDDGRPVRSGILFDVRINADTTSNSLLVTAPEESMDLIAALVDQLDRIPEVETQIKVFQIVNGDAQTIFEMLQTLFQSQAQGNAGGNFFGGVAANQQTANLPLQTASAQAGATITGLNFSVDQRTNTIIASGPVGDLQLIEDLLIRLDEEEAMTHQVVVYRISNLFAEDMATAVNEWLDNRRSLITGVDPTSINPYTTARREVVVVPEVVSNSLIINARPEYLDEVLQVIQALDRRPPMIKIKVLIAEVNLSMLEEFGIDAGVQDSILFDRGLNTIRYPFNQAGIGNDNTAASLATRENLAGQGLVNLGTGRINSDLGYGGLVLSAGNESINLLLRALKDRQCARVLSSPHVMAIEGQPGRIQIGSTVRFISGSNVTGAGVVQNTVEPVDIGVILEITPRVTPDGMIVMRVNATNSTLGADDQGTTVSIAPDGTPVRVPPILKTTAQTVIMARHGQTVAFGGLIREERSRFERGVPVLSDVPLLGNLFKYKGENSARKELMIILTPYMVDDDTDIDRLNQEDFDRMHWCINDVAEIYGSVNYDEGPETYNAPAVYYPDQDPSGLSFFRTNQQQPSPRPTLDGPSYDARQEPRPDWSQPAFEPESPAPASRSPQQPAATPASQSSQPGARPAQGPLPRVINGGGSSTGQRPFVSNPWSREREVAGEGAGNR